MRILWISNIQFPATCKKLGIPTHVSGGWMISLAEMLKDVPGIVLSICTTYSGPDLLRIDDEGIAYYLLPREKSNAEYDKSLEKQWPKVINEFKPDLVHIHGTEYAHGLSCLNSCPESKFVISIQGLVSAASEFYFAGINTVDILRHITLYDIIKKETLFQQKRKFKRRDEIEKEYINRILHIIGRTDWDKAHSLAINPHMEYHMCNEMLRNGFYLDGGWDIGEKNDFSLFLSQAGYPLKGLHQVLKAIAIVKKSYPSVQLRIAGIDITKSDTLREKLKIGGYGSYLKSLMKKLELTSNVTFTGMLDQNGMVQELKKAHLFICPSSIENSSNSLAEAQLIGVPSIASFVGGLPSMVKHGETGLLYRFEDYRMLAYHIMSIFENNHLALKLSRASQDIAAKRHKREEICSQILKIYREVISG